MTDDAPQSLELRPYQRLNRTYALMTIGLPSLLCGGLFVASGAAFWLLPILFLGGAGLTEAFLNRAPLLAGLPRPWPSPSATPG